MHGALLHEVNDLVLHNDCVINVIIKLHLDLVLELTALVEWLLIFYWLSEVFVILGKEVHFADVGPRVKAITHGVLGPNAEILSASEKEELMDLLVEMLPVEHMR